jgi:hypothetical protein
MLVGSVGEGLRVGKIDSRKRGLLFKRGFVPERSILLERLAQERGLTFQKRVCTRLEHPVPPVVRMRLHPLAAISQIRREI